MSKQNNLTDFLTDVADAIRAKKERQGEINPQDFSAEIESIPSGGTPKLQEKTVTPSAITQVAVPSAGYDGLSKVTVVGDDNLVSENIKNNVKIFGITGSYTGETPTVVYVRPFNNIY